MGTAMATEARREIIAATKVIRAMMRVGVKGSKYLRLDMWNLICGESSDKTENSADCVEYECQWWEGSRALYVGNKTSFSYAE